jgi:hypothetical protein
MTSLGASQVANGHSRNQKQLASSGGFRPEKKVKAAEAVICSLYCFFG